MSHTLKGKTEMVDGEPWFRMARPSIGIDRKGKPFRFHDPEKWGNSWLVKYPTGTRYNGGIIINDKWYQGFRISAPKLPKGYKLVSIGVGLQLNARPPYATQLLKKQD